MCHHASCNYQVRRDPEMESLLAAMKRDEGDPLEEEGLNTCQEEQEAAGVGGGGEDAGASEGQQVEVELHPQTKEEQTWHPHA